MLKKMTGSSEIKSVVMGIQREMPALRKDIKDELRIALQSAESRMIEAISTQVAEMFAEFKEQSNPANVVKAIEQSEEDKEKEIAKKSIIRNLSEVYTIEQEANVIESNSRGGSKLTAEGQRMYDIFSQTVLDIAKLYGSKSHMRVVNRGVYEEFGELKGLSGELKKKYITLKNGTARESVYADIIERGLLGKFAKFIEDKYELNA